MSDTATHWTPDHVDVIYRRMKFRFSQESTARYWHDNSPFITHFWGALSTAFPGGERFFMDSARAYYDRITDPRLKEQVDAFIKQEAHHTYQHRKFNKIVEGFGFPIEEYEKVWNREIDKAREQLDEEQQLATTMALEHFTAGFAHQYLTNPKISRGADPEIKALWAWHAAEEAEHKAVCYDLYLHVGGSYGNRIKMLFLSWFGILVITLLLLRDMLKRDGKLWNVRDNLRGLWYLFGYRGLISGMLPAFIRYLRPGFHPWQQDDSHLIAEWKTANLEYIANEG